MWNLVHFVIAKYEIFCRGYSAVDRPLISRSWWNLHQWKQTFILYMARQINCFKAMYLQMIAILSRHTTCSTNLLPWQPGNHIWNVLISKNTNFGMLYMHIKFCSSSSKTKKVSKNWRIFAKICLRFVTSTEQRK